MALLHCDAMFSKLKRLLPGAARSASDRTFPPEWREHLKSGQAASVRDALRQALAGDKQFPVAGLLATARGLDWSNEELAKLATYADFFTGEVARAYERVMQKGLARSDYAMFATACAYCYDYDRFEEGYALLQQFHPGDAQDLDPVRFGAYAGYIALSGGRGIDEACGYFDAALATGQWDVMLVVNAYPTYFEAGHYGQVARLHRLIMDHCADDPMASFALACVELARDYYPEGFRLAETRYRMPEVARFIPLQLVDKPRWQGELASGSHLLVHGEQGLGDVVMMARYLPLIADKVAQVTVGCRPAAIPLLAHNFPDCRFVEGDGGKCGDIGCDLWIGMMSLPYLLDTTADTVPATKGYLAAPPDQAAYWQQRCQELSRPRVPRIGLAWSGNPGHRADRRRSLRWEQIEGFLQQHSGVDFFALQTSLPVSRPGNLIDVSEEMLTLADTAAIIAEMDLIISVDTSTVHIAGALGKPTWLLLPHRYEWRWSLAGEANNWYDTVRVLRQERCGEWGPLLEDVFERRLPQWLLGRDQ